MSQTSTTRSHHALQNLQNVYIKSPKYCVNHSIATHTHTQAHRHTEVTLLCGGGPSSFFFLCASVYVFWCVLLVFLSGMFLLLLQSRLGLVLFSISFLFFTDFFLIFFSLLPFFVLFCLLYS